MKIAHTQHLIRRLNEREIPHHYPERIITEAEQEYYDISTQCYIAVKKFRHAGKMRNMVVAYDIINDTRRAVTIHPISEGELKN